MAAKEEGGGRIFPPAESAKRGLIISAETP